MPKKEKKPDPLKIFVHDDIMVDDVAPGQVGKIPPVEGVVKPTEEELDKLYKEEEAKTQKEYKRLMTRYVPPHKIKSRKVLVADLEKVLAEGQDLLMLCHFPRGKFSKIHAIAHPQIEDKDPLRFFVLPNGFIVINPFIYDHTKALLFDTEGCLSFPDEDPKTMVPRYYKIQIKYQTVLRDKKNKIGLSDFIDVEIKGPAARVFQHELDHLNGYNIYEKDFSPINAVGLGGDSLIFVSEWVEQ